MRFEDRREEFRDAVKEILGDEITVTYSKFALGNNGFFVSFYHKNVKVTRHNSDINTCLMVEELGPNNYTITKNMCLAKGVTFRKIKADSPEKLLEKLLKWISKNADTIIEQAIAQNIKDNN